MLPDTIDLVVARGVKFSARRTAAHGVRASETIAIAMVSGEVCNACETAKFTLLHH
jgi:hypothetical protein